MTWGQDNGDEDYDYEDYDYDLLNQRNYKYRDDIISVLHCRQLETELLYRSREANKVLSRGIPNPGEKCPFPNPQSPPLPLFPVPRPKRTDTTEIKISRKKNSKKNKTKSKAPW
jgi:hypothetical protein